MAELEKGREEFLRKEHEMQQKMDLEMNDKWGSFMTDLKAKQAEED